MKKIIALTLLYISNLIAAPCNNLEFSSFISHSGHTYAISNNTFSFFEARDLAINAGGVLMTPNTQEENDLLVSNGWSGWLGVIDRELIPNYCMNALNCIADDKRFTYVDGSNLVFRSWSIGEPNNVVYEKDISNGINPLGENWVVVNNGLWSSVGIHYNSNPSYKAIVEWDSELDCVSKSINPTYNMPMSGLWCTDGTDIQECKQPANTTYNSTLHRFESKACGNQEYISSKDKCKSKEIFKTDLIASGICHYGFTIPCPYYSGDYSGYVSCILYGSGGCYVTVKDIEHPSYGWSGSMQYTYSCPSGYTKSGTECKKEVITYTTPKCNKETPNRDKSICYIEPNCLLGSFDCKSSNNKKEIDTTQGNNDKRANGTVDKEGNCSGNFYIFNGKDYRCRKNDYFGGVGISGGCCDKDKVLLGLVNCEENEKGLAKLRSKNKCHYIGDYCASKFLGVCTKSKETHCCFNSILARIIHEQGRPQIDKGWGNPKKPNCSGFTPSNFQKLDFSKIDFSEFYEDIKNKINTSIFTNLGNTIKNKVNKYYIK
jgi:conjugal transfer mating pair stabilization protein TraN